ncbi:hypothetical protein PMIN01_13538 [Paraphaeosphaeria minitans]|uniref:Uncharacterized protein n=1 Tax=Paraphaeosphaeria minitans TaxID=565426 RepID=A0A9P6G5U9_9PLEO|nr:hypothetical protein PMIN01_13538 [Paraphaeosphaeria minitans]
MVSEDFTADTAHLFNTNFSGMVSGEVPYSFSPGPLGPSGNFAAEQASSATRDGRPDVQIAPESHENEIVQALHELTSAEIARGKRQDQLLNYILKALEALKGRQDTRDASQEAIRRQLAAIQSLLKSHPRRSDPLPLSANAQNTHSARPGRIPLPETAQRDTDERSVPASQQDKLPHDIQQQVFRFMQQQQEQQQHQSNPNRPNFQM